MTHISSGRVCEGAPSVRHRQRRQGRHLLQRSTPYGSRSHLRSYARQCCCAAAHACSGSGRGAASAVVPFGSRRVCAAFARLRAACSPKRGVLADVMSRAIRTFRRRMRERIKNKAFAATPRAPSSPRPLLYAFSDRRLATAQRFARQPPRGRALRAMTSYAGSTQRRDWTFSEASLDARREAALRAATQARAACDESRPRRALCGAIAGVLRPRRVLARPKH